MRFLSESEHECAETDARVDEAMEVEGFGGDRWCDAQGRVRIVHPPFWPCTMGGRSWPRVQDFAVILARYGAVRGSVEYIPKHYRRWFGVEE